MQGFWKTFFSLRLGRRFYVASSLSIFCYILAFLAPSLLLIVHLLFGALCIYILFDIFQLYRHRHPLMAMRRSIYTRLSNGDDNEFNIYIRNLTPASFDVWFFEDFPLQLQIRNRWWFFSLPGSSEHSITYTVRPVERGEYEFGNVNFLLRRKRGILQRYYRVDAWMVMPCYPSFIRLRQFEFLAIHNRLHEMGIKRVRKIGRSTEFEQIKEYVQGDDIKVVNWKATARMNKLMVNHYVDEKSQPVYALLDMGRSMYMPFRGMTLLDYAINASLVFSHVAWVKSDKPGVIAFEKDIQFHLAASNKGDQLYKIQEQLYRVQTGFDESSYFHLYKNIRKHVRQRSLMLLFTNLEYIITLQRKIKYLQRINKFHRLVVVIFQNTELKQLIEADPESTYDMFRQGIALQFENQKRKIMQELSRHGILSIYTTPENLTVNVINKYLEIKARNLF